LMLHSTNLQILHMLFDHQQLNFQENYKSCK
jgi:hypothetical protein